MSPGGRTRDDDTSCPFRTYVGTPDGSWPTATGWSVTCQSGFLGSTGMSIHGSGLLQTLRLLRQMTVQLGIRARVDGAMGHPDVFRNPEEVMRLMQGIQSKWSMLEQMPASQRKSKSPWDGPV